MHGVNIPMAELSIALDPENIPEEWKCSDEEYKFHDDKYHCFINDKLTTDFQAYLMFSRSLH